jgi:adenosine deaminase
MTALSPAVRAFLTRFRLAPKTELHLHLEGAVSAPTLVRLSSRTTTPIFPDVASVRARRRPGDPESFFALYRDVCRQLRSPGDYAAVARDLVRRLVRERIRHAEVYVSPAIVEKIGLSWPEVVDALEPVFEAHERSGSGTVRVLLDSVRQWGPGAAHRVLDLHAARPWARVVGFGLGGVEGCIPAREFAPVYRRVRSLGLAPLVHAGEWGGPDSIADVLRWLSPVRIAHGFRAADDPGLVKQLVRRRIVLDVCPTSNLATGALGALGPVRPGAVHPVLALVRAGVRVTLSTDDPGLFGTTLLSEYQRLASWGARVEELRAIAACSRGAALLSPPAPSRRRRGTAGRSRPR